MLTITLTKGDRGLLVGKSGSGKTTLGLELVRSMPLPVLIVDTKYSEVIAEYAARYRWPIVSAFPNRLEGVIVWRPMPLELSDPWTIDLYLETILEARKPVSIYIDELYQLHNNGKAGPGLIGLYTRGRERGFCILGGSQRPAWVSLFCLTESSKYFVMRLDLPQDKKRMAEIIGDSQIADTSIPNRFFWYTQNGGRAEIIRPIRPKA